MDEETKNWTSLDLYYKGFHIKKSWGENISRVTLMAEIDGLITAGFKPSWNDETNRATVPVQAPIVAPTPAYVPQPSNVPVKQYVDLTPDQIIAKYNLTDMVALQVKTPCKRCGGQQIYSSKSGKVFCKAKCWIK